MFQNIQMSLTTIAVTLKTTGCFNPSFSTFVQLPMQNQSLYQQSILFLFLALLRKKSVCKVTEMYVHSLAGFLKRLHTFWSEAIRISSLAAATAIPEEKSSRAYQNTMRGDHIYSSIPPGKCAREDKAKTPRVKKSHRERMTELRIEMNGFCCSASES